LKRQRLVTVTGMGGMGKTRLAKQVSAELLDDFPDGVWMIECDTLDSRAQLVGTLASVLNVSETDSDIEASLVRKISTKKLLLFFDCFERIVEHADVLDNLLKHSPDCQMLVTSRVVLGLPREFEYRLSPMKLKKRGVEASDGVSLFLEAASHSVNSFELTAKNRALVQELCQELEGVPLALVLAAGRLRHLSLTELLEQVRLHPLEVLRRRGGPKDRQADLYRVVASSFLLLGARECGLLDKLSLFVGGFYADDAAEICNWSKTEMLQGLSTLRDHSLLQVQSLERTRFKLLDTVREFLEQLPRDDGEAEERQACAERHAERYARTAEEIGRFMDEGRWTEGTTLLWSEIGNLRSACNFTAKFHQYRVCRRLAIGLARTYFEMALNADFEQLAQASLAAAEALVDPELEARIVGLLGAQSAMRKDEQGWRSMWSRRVSICEAIGDLDGSTDSLFDMAWECVLLGQMDEAHENLRRATDSAKAAGLHHLLASCYVAGAQIALKENKETEARQLADLATREVSLSKNKTRMQYVSQHLTHFYETIGDLNRASASCAAMLNLAFEGHRHRGVAWALLKLADLHEKVGENDLALYCLLAAVRLQAEFATRQGEKSKTLLAQFTKRHGEDLDQQLSAHKKTPWRVLIRNLPYFGNSVAAT